MFGERYNKFEVIIMSFTFKKKKSKIESVCKSIYIPLKYDEKIKEMASKNDTSYSYIIVNMIEYCLKESKGY